MAVLNQKIQLPDGRKLGYNEYGAPNGWPIFYFHGSPSARIEFELFGDDTLLESHGARLIAVDRPGIGLSDFQQDRLLMNWPGDVIALADHLQIDRFAVLAYSLGGPYGLACAYYIPDRLSSVGIVSGSALFSNSDLMAGINAGTRRYLTLPRDHPTLARIFLRVMAMTARYAPKVAVANASALLPDSDRAVVASPAVQRGFIAMVGEAMRQGTRGSFHESLLTVTDWGFRPEDILMPVNLWHGEADQNIPVVMARHLAAALPHCEAIIIPGEGHLSLIKKYLGEIIQTLTESPVMGS